MSLLAGSVIVHFFTFLCCSYFEIAIGQNGRYAVMFRPPESPCPQYYEYEYDGSSANGKIKLPSPGFGTTNIIVGLSQRGTDGTEQFRFTYNPNEASQNIIDGKPLIFKILFPNVNAIPRLTRIAVNNQNICTGSGYAAPSTQYNVKTNILAQIKSSPDTARTTPYSQSSAPVRVANTASNFNGNPFLSNFLRTTTQQPRQTYSELPQYLEIIRRANTENKPTITTTQKKATRPITTTRQPITAQPISTTRNVEEICGLRSPSFSTFINFGQQLEPVQIPWLVALYRKVPGGVYFMCGGTLVSARTVITAAHCLQSHVTENDVVVHIGKHNLEDYREKFEMRQADKLIIHPDFNATSPPDADIGILQFTEPIRIDSVIIPICLWSGDESIAEIVGQKGYVAGWGADEHGNNVTSIPKVVSANIASESDCLRDTGLHRHLISPRTLCAGNLDATGPCTGDSGGGLMIQRNGRWHLRGILSGGARIDGKCNLKSHVLYCDIAKHMTWIRSNLLY